MSGPSSPHGYGWVYTCTCTAMSSNLTSMTHALQACADTGCSGVWLPSCNDRVLPDEARLCHSMECSATTTRDCLLVPTVPHLLPVFPLSALVLQVVAFMLICATQRLYKREKEDELVTELIGSAKTIKKRYKNRSTHRQSASSVAKSSAALRRSTRGRVDPLAPRPPSAPLDEDMTDADGRWWWLRWAQRMSAKASTNGAEKEVGVVMEKRVSVPSTASPRADIFRGRPLVGDDTTSQEAGGAPSDTVKYITSTAAEWLQTGRRIVDTTTSRPQRVIARQSAAVLDEVGNRRGAATAAKESVAFAQTVADNVVFDGPLSLNPVQTNDTYFGKQISRG